ncbi:MAG: ATP-dependent Clp protease ATP-binding subunit [Saprospiraceae bacterium]|nr:ATP-dependent Clp protease ATP-binding subunit [Saprospiraceae bacterium]
MSTSLTIPFYAFKLHFHAGSVLTMPMNDRDALRLGQPLRVVAAQYAASLQQTLLNKGQFHTLLETYREGDFLKNFLHISFPKSTDGQGYPDFELQFEYYYNIQPGGLWGIVPALGVEGFGKDATALLNNLQETIRLEFAANRRLAYVQNIVSTIWFQSIELLQHPINLDFPRPAEVERPRERQVASLLEKVVTPLDILHQEVYGRQPDLEQLGRALKGRFNRNVLLVGPSGVGKTALVWEMAHQHKKFRIKGRILETTASLMIKELMTEEAGWEYNLPLLCKELATTEDYLFVRNLAELFEVGKYEGNEVSIADYLLPFLSRGEINMISECTEEELAMIELKSPTYVAQFQLIRLEEPPEEELEHIVLGKIKELARLANMSIEDEAIREAIRLHRRFAPYSGMPGKPIRFLEALLPGEKTASTPVHIRRQDVLRRFCEESGMPPFIVDPDIPMDSKAVLAHFNNQVFGQETAVAVLGNVLTGIKTALSKTGKPIASLLFVGPTGVGKTEVAKILAGFMFGGRDRMVRFDMSEFSDYGAVNRLIGTGPGSDGQLTSAVRREPFCVLLFDEIEKADAGFFDLLLQILGEGRLSDGAGSVVNFCSAIIIMTSNIGAARFQMGRVRLQQGADQEEAIAHFMNVAQQHFRPELFNRIDELIPFSPLDQLSVRFVVEREIALLKQREGIRFRRMSLKIEEPVLDFLAEQGYHEKYGARYLQRTIRERLVLPLARKINQEDFDERLDIQVVLSDGKPAIQIRRDPLALDLLLEELEKANYANYGGTLRRRIQGILSGYLYSSFSSEMRTLERLAHKEQKAFWQHPQQAARYSALLSLADRGRELTEQIEAIEMSLSIAVLGIEPYQPALLEAIEQWETRFFDWRKALCEAGNPDGNRCFVHIYGAQPLDVCAFYQAMFAQLGFSFNGAAIWFRDRYYQAIKAEADASKTVKDPFFRTLCEPNSLEIPQPDEKGDVLFGMIFKVEGPCAALFLEPEEGLQRWRNKEGKDQHYMIKIAKEPLVTPMKIHRQDYYSQEAPRRILTLNSLKDTIYQINREYQREEWKLLLYKSLEAQFKIRLDDEVT